MKIMIPCPDCAQTAYKSFEDRHARTNQDRCERCGNTGEIEAKTGECREASFNPDSGKAYAEDPA